MRLQFWPLWEVEQGCDQGSWLCGVKGGFGGLRKRERAGELCCCKWLSLVAAQEMCVGRGTGQACGGLGENGSRRLEPPSSPHPVSPLLIGPGREEWARKGGKGATSENRRR